MRVKTQITCQQLLLLISCSLTLHELVRRMLVGTDIVAKMGWYYEGIAGSRKAMYDVVYATKDKDITWKLPWILTLDSLNSFGYSGNQSERIYTYFIMIIGGII